MHHWICLVKTLRLSTHMTIFLIIIFLIKKVAKLVETQKFRHHRLDHSFLHQGSYSHFLIWWIFRKLAFYHLFWGISNEKIYVTPPGRNWKKITRILFYKNSYLIGLFCQWTYYYIIWCRSFSLLNIWLNRLVSDFQMFHLLLITGRYRTVVSERTDIKCMNRSAS